jgi:hypothetical protein
MKLKTASLIFAAVFASTLTACAWWQKHEGQFDCAALATVNDSASLLAIVEACAVVAVAPANILACVEGAAGSQWTTDVLKCFVAAQAGKATCPAFSAAKVAKARGGGK